LTATTELKRQNQRNIIFGDDRLSIDKHCESALTEWNQEMQRQGKSQHTLAAYQRGLTHFMTWNQQTYGDNFDPARIIPRDVRDWKAHQLSVENASPATVNQRLVAVSRFFRWALKQGLVVANPVEDIQTMRLDTRQPKALKERALRRLLREASADVRDYALVETMVGTGVRVGELLALRIGDVVIGDRSGKLIIRRGKHDTQRVIPLTLDVRKALEAYLQTHPERDHPKAALWWGQDHPLQHRSSVLRILEKYALRAGLEPVNPHALRHTFATRYLAANPGDLRGLARLLGHANLNTVMIYTEPDMDDLTRRMERVEAKEYVTDSGDMPEED
jgi:site-specific recombinase XerD